MFVGGDYEGHPVRLKNVSLRYSDRESKNIDLIRRSVLDGQKIYS